MVCGDDKVDPPKPLMSVIPGKVSSHESYHARSQPFRVPSLHPFAPGRDVSLLLASVVPVLEGAVLFFLEYMVLADDGLGGCRRCGIFWLVVHVFVYDLPRLSDVCVIVDAGIASVADLNGCGRVS